MQVNVEFAFNAMEELQLANEYSGGIRLMMVGARVESKTAPLDDLPAVDLTWQAASNTSLPSFSALCWYQAKSIWDGRKGGPYSEIPIGLIESCWGGTPIKTWTDAQVGATCASVYPTPVVDCGLYHAPCNQSALYNAMIAPLAGLRLSWMVWMQGENDVGEAVKASTGLAFPFYACQLSNMITSLRTLFQSPQAWWVTVQLAPYNENVALAAFRTMQCQATQSVVNTTCVVINDGGDIYSPIGSVHSRNKQLSGARVAAAILVNVFQQPGQLEGPTYLSAQVEGGGSTGAMSATISFTTSSLGGANGSLVYVAPHVSPYQNSSRCPGADPGSPITESMCGWFSILGSDGVSYNATAVEIVGGGTQLLLQVPSGVPNGVTPIGTSAGFNAWPVVNFYNQAGLPLVSWNTTA